MHLSPQPDAPREFRVGQGRRRRRSILVAAAGVLAGVMVVSCGSGAQQPGDADSESEAPIVTQPTDSVSPKTFPTGEEPVALEADTYLVSGAVAGGDSSLASYTVTVPEGWTGDSGSDLKKNEDTPQAIGISPWVLDDIGIFEDACRGKLGDPPSPASAADVVSLLRAQESGPIVSDPVATTLGGHRATRIDLDYPVGEARTSCRAGTGQLQVFGWYYVFPPDHTASFYVVEVKGWSQVLVVDTADGASVADREELQSILDSIRFEQAE